MILDILGIMSGAGIRRGRGANSRTSVSGSVNVGQLVVHPGVPGIGRVGETDADTARIDCFESIAEPVAESWWVPASECRRVTLAVQTRVFWLDPSTGAWRVGRVIGGEPASGYFVRLPNTDFDFPAAEADLRVRWDRPVREPHLVLATGGHESGYFRDARLPMLKSLIDQRAASASVPAILSSAIEIYPHQVRAVMAILSDPIQRYLLADEVGLGKTVEAGVIIRQTLLDNPAAKIVVLTPEPLRRQWSRELTDKFFIDDFRDAAVTITSHATPDRWRDYQGADLVVVDEAHELVTVGDPAESPYQQLCGLAHSTQRLLLLSATPATANTLMYLGLLHLLDRDLYRWDDRAGFERRYELRKDLASATYALSATFISSLPTTIGKIAAMVPDDSGFAGLAGAALALLDSEGELRDESDATELGIRVESMRAHISETYRLHRRVIRHRRTRVLVDDESVDQVPYEVRGRSVPAPIEVDSQSQWAVAEFLVDWQSQVRDWCLDHDSADAQAYGMVLAVLASRAGCLPSDFVDALRWRTARDEEAARRTRLTPYERQVLAGPEIVDREVRILDHLVRTLAEIDDTRDQAALLDVLLPALPKGRRIIVFCGPGALASDLAALLGRRLPTAEVGEHTARAGAASSEKAVTTWQSPILASSYRILVADETADDGLNLQTADIVVHCRLPWNPNRLEQRLGRVDRYRGPESASQRQPAVQFVLADTTQSDSFLNVWLTQLRDGFGIFDQSISALQDAVTRTVPEVWTAAVEHGPPGLPEFQPKVREAMDRELREIDRLDMLESIHGAALEVRDIAESLTELEMDWRGIQAAMLGYAGDDSGGQRFRYQVLRQQSPQRWSFLSSGEPLIPPRMFRTAMSAMPPRAREATFNRSAALSRPGTRLFRQGNPFLDMLAGVVAIDDRGQAAAFRRFDQRHRGGPDIYFGFDYLVEADIEQAMTLLENQPTARTAVRRQADRFFPPFMLRSWVSARGYEPILGRDEIGWLDAPYNKTKGDRNFNTLSAGELHGLFNGVESFRESVSEAQASARKALEINTEMLRRCAEAQDQARKAMAIAHAQALARQAAGRLVGDADSYAADVSLATALIDGLSEPAVREVGAACIVRTGMIRVTHGT